MTARIGGPTAYADAIGATSVTGPSIAPRYRHPYDPAVTTPTHTRSETTGALTSTFAGVTAAQRAKQRANSATCATVSVMKLLPRRRDAIVAARSPTPHSAATPNPRITVAPPLRLRGCRLRSFVRAMTGSISGFDRRSAAVTIRRFTTNPEGYARSLR